jgi:DNA polymerase (family 10)
MPIENAEVARLFREVADLLELQGRTLRCGYQNAARTVEELPQPEELVPGTASGSPICPESARISPARSARSCGPAPWGRSASSGGGPQGRRRPDANPGLGPKRLARCTTPRHPHRRATRARLPGRQGAPVAPLRREDRANILHELTARHADEHRMPRPVAAQYGEAFLRYLQSVEGVKRAEIAGSYRRRRDTVGDLDILVTCRRGTPAVQRFVGYPEVEEVLEKGATRASVRLRAGLQVDLRVLAEPSYGAGLYYFTGSKAHNIAVRRLAQKRGLRINEYGVYRGTRRVGGRTSARSPRRSGCP